MFFMTLLKSTFDNRIVRVDSINKPIVAFQFYRKYVVCGWSMLWRDTQFSVRKPLSPSPWL